MLEFVIGDSVCIIHPYNHPVYSPLYHDFCVILYHFTMFIAITIEQVSYVQIADPILTQSSLLAYLIQVKSRPHCFCQKPLTPDYILLLQCT